MGFFTGLSVLALLCGLFCYRHFIINLFCLIGSVTGRFLLLAPNYQPFLLHELCYRPFLAIDPLLPVFFVKSALLSVISCYWPLITGLFSCIMGLMTGRFYYRSLTVYMGSGACFFYYLGLTIDLTYGSIHAFLSTGYFILRDMDIARKSFIFSSQGQFLVVYLTINCTKILDLQQ